MSFSTSVEHVGDTTGYTSNKGVWARAMFHQKRGPFTKKRKKWTLSNDPACYKIAEREEEEEVKLPQIVAPDPDPGVPVIETNPKHVAFNLDRAMDTPDKPVHEIGSMSRQRGVVSGEIPEIVVEECQQVRPQEKTEEKSKPKTSLLMPPVPRQNQGQAMLFHTVPKAAVYSLSYERKDEPTGETNCRAQPKYLTSPRYTHIRVPRRHILVTHVSQESVDSPLKFPRIDAETVGRKPVTVTLTKSLSLNKGHVRRRWNFHSLDEPIQIYTRPQSASSTTSEVSPNPDSLESHRKSESHDGCHSGKRVLLQDEKLINSGANGINTDGKCVVLISKNGALSKTNRRKKWVLPEHWPSQDPSSLGQ